MKILWNGAGGFIRLDLNEHSRYHIYHPELRAFISENDGGIHDHRFKMTSRVLCGALHHHVYDVIPHQRGDHLIWELHNDDFKNPVPCTINKSRIDKVSAGEDYRFGGLGWFHYVVPEPDVLTITCVTKTWSDESIEAHVICEKPSKPLNAFDQGRKPPNMVLYQYAVDALKQHYGNLLTI